MLDLNDKALKEWAVVVLTLERGDHVLLLRKGGITEEGGSFRVREPEFFLFANHTHQNAEQLKPQARGLLKESEADRPDEGNIRFTSYAEVAEVFTVPSLEALRRLEGAHVWSPDYVEERFVYRPFEPMYGLVLRVYRLPEPIDKFYLASYGGCTSWVTLDEPLPTRGAVPVLDDESFERRRLAIRSLVSG